MENLPSEAEEQTNFPFVETASGNLKIVPQQVVYESKQLSIVAANPGRTKINVKGRKNSMSGIQSQMWQDLCLMRERGGDGDSDVPSEGCDNCLVSVDKSTKNRTVVAKLSDEMSLAQFGFSEKVPPLNWEKAEIPEKEDLYDLLELRITNYINSDIFIKIGNHEYRCHLLVLQCYSGFFHDKHKGRLEISEKFVTKTAFAYIYDWMLHKGPDSYKLLNRDNILEIFMASQYLQVKELEEQCWTFIDNEELFNEDKAFILYLDARAINNTTIMELMVPRIQRFFLTLVATKDFLDLSVPEVMVFLSSNFICVRAEMDVFMSAVRWLLYDWERRQKHAVDVMSCVRFGLFEPKDLVDIQRNQENKEYQLVTRHPQIAAMIEDGLAYAIVKYWNLDKNTDYEHSLDNLRLSSPMPRNWAGNTGGKNIIRKYEEFLNELHRYRQIHIKAMKAAREKSGGDFGETLKKSEVDSASNYSFRPGSFN